MPILITAFILFVLMSLALWLSAKLDRWHSDRTRMAIPVVETPSNRRLALRFSGIILGAVISLMGLEMDVPNMILGGLVLAAMMFSMR